MAAIEDIFKKTQYMTMDVTIPNAESSVTMDVAATCSLRQVCTLLIQKPLAALLSLM